MKIISYIAMIATAAFCQSSFGMNQAPNRTDRNQPPHAARTLDMWSLNLPSDFSVKSVPAKNRVVEVDFDNNEVRISAAMRINISFDGSEVMGSTSLSFVRTSFPSVIQIPTVNPHAPSTPFIAMRQPQPPTFTIQTCTTCAPSAPFMSMRQPTEMKEEKKQERIDSQKKTGNDSELSEILKEKKKEEKGKNPKTPESLKEIESSNSHTEEVDKKKAKQTDKIDRKSFLDTYSKTSLDSKAKKQIKALFDKGIKSPAKLLDELLTPSNTTRREKNFEQVRNKVGIFISNLKTGRETID